MVLSFSLPKLLHTRNSHLSTNQPSLQLSKSHERQQEVLGQPRFYGLGAPDNVVDMMVEPSTTLSPHLRTIDRLVCDVSLNHMRFSEVNSRRYITKYCENNMDIVKQK